MRVVSLLASATEIVCALGAEAQLVGRSHECDFPPSVRSLPTVTAPRFATHGSSADIDRQVKAGVAGGSSLYVVDAAALDALEPDLLLTQDQCEVCAVSLRDVESAVCQLVSSQPQIVTLLPNALPDIWADIAKVAAALGLVSDGERLVSRLQARLDRVAQATSALPSPTVACIEWLEPLMAAGNWMPTLVELVGGRNLFGVAGQHSPWLTWDALVASDPDVIVVMPCGFELARTLDERQVLAAHPAWSSLRAVKSGRVAVADGNQYFNRPGPRVVESVEILAEIVHVGVDYGHRGRGWVSWA